MAKVKIYLTDFRSFKSHKAFFKNIHDKSPDHDGKYIIYFDGPVDWKKAKNLLCCFFSDPDNFKNVTVFHQHKNKAGGRYEILQKMELTKDGKFNSDLLELDSDGAVCRINGLVGTLNRTVKIGSEEYDVTLEMRSRFDERDKPWLLGTMLEIALQGNVKFNSIENNIASDELDLLGILSVTLFCSTLKSAYKSGVYKTYVRREYNDSRLRGTLDIPRHIRLNVGRNDTVAAYTTRELTYDNELNHLIMHAWNFLRSMYPKIADALIYGSSRDDELYSIITELKSMTAATDMRLDRCAAKCQRPITGPFYMKYEELRKLCLRIIGYRAKANIFSGNGENVSGILFYSPDLWEVCCEERMRDVLKGHGYEITAQVEMKLYRHFVIDDKEKDNSLFNNNYDHDIRPDYVVYKDEKPIAVLDAKFRVLEIEDKDLNKLLRDMTCFGAHIGGLIYPHKEGADVKNNTIQAYYLGKHVNSDKKDVPITNNKAIIYTYHVPVPDVNKNGSYNEWKEKLYKGSEDTFGRLKEHLDSLGKE